jgi:3-dehydroquinate dehydratase
MGGEVLISSHLHTFFEEEEILRYAKEQKKRGADVVKIVSMSDSDEQLLSNIVISFRLKKELDSPFLFLAGGSHCRLLREIGGSLGSCMILCLQSYKPVSAKVQVQLRAAKAIRDSMIH